MHSETKHELLGALQYFLIGIIAEGCVIRWFDKNTGGEQMMIWIVIAFTLTVLRIVILFYATMVSRSRMEIDFAKKMGLTCPASG
ncbi:MAG: hypothetical protein IPO77_04580 [Acidobacteria bacterium]|nr:hypothetical protein [Acidobacteriota bacterium]